MQRHRTPDGLREARIGEEQQLSVVHAAAMVEEVIALRRIERDFGRGEERVVDRFARIGARHLRRIGEEGLRLGALRTVHILRRAVGDDPAALRGEAFEQVERRGIDVLHLRRQHHRPVGAFAHDEAVALDRTVVEQDILRSQIELHLMPFQRGDEGLELLAHRPPAVRARCVVGVIHPDRGGGFEHQHVVVLAARRERQRQTGEVEVQLAVILPPRRMGREGGRIVVLARTGDAQRRDMLVHEVHAQRIFPVALTFEVAQRHVPTAAAVGFAQLAHAPHLVGRTVDLLHRTHVAEVSVGRFDVEFVVQQVDARHLLPGVHGHVVGIVPHVGPPVLPEMAGEDQAVALAIVVADLDVAIQEEIHQHVAVVVPHLPPRADLLPERDQIGFEVVSPAGAEGVEQVGRPADRLAVGHHDLRLVGEPARNGAAELLAHDLLVTVERQFDEFVGHALVHQIHVREAAVPRRRGVVSLVEEVVIALFATPRSRFGRDVGKGVAFALQAAAEAVDRIGQHLGAQVFERHALVVALGHRLVDVAARKTARIGVLVVDPDVHVQFAALLHRVAEEREPVVVEILRHHARAGVYEDAAETLVFEVGHRFVDPFGRHDLVPDEERRRAVLLGRCRELRAQALEIFRCRKVAPVRRSAGDGQQPQKGPYRTSECSFHRLHNKSD